MTYTARVVVLDIEGTTSAAGFVQGDLYDYARPRLRSWISDHADDPAISSAVAETRAEGGLADDADLDAVVAVPAAQPLPCSEIDGWPTFWM